MRKNGPSPSIPAITNSAPHVSGAGLGGDIDLLDSQRIYETLVDVLNRETLAGTDGLSIVYGLLNTIEDTCASVVSRPVPDSLKLLRHAARLCIAEVQVMLSDSQSSSGVTVGTQGGPS